jgi:hypothetical protein
MIAALGLAQADEVAALRQFADRVGAMLTALIRREERRAGDPRAKYGSCQ